ncbi:pseudouridine synthase [Oribacterium sp. WCC10]|uniref:pseudouridine synthase n=1 Tax=Oribacterium sp. WCC10 TaxID=1855343 RepID=UPI0008EB0AB3|nr:pseudouridine synthase [Oribacterium sp. WCC10]SFG26679.1 23S rRNA pseudouridine2604 synthase [Oribacterium sp. WCC10]
MRINKRLSELGVCSRREADRLVEAGRITVNGKPVEMGQQVTEEDSIELDGICVNPHALKANIKNPEERYLVETESRKMSTRYGEQLSRAGQDYDKPKPVLLAYNKPRGIVCTTSDKDKAPNIIDAIKYPYRVYPIGRLDKESEGLILLTNQGDLVNRINRARNFHEKEYVVTTDKALTKEFLDKLADGVYIQELDVTTRPCEVWQDMTLPAAKRQHEFHIVITQGLNRQIRRMCKTFGYTVKKLKRIRIMNLTLGGLKTGQYREIELSELTDDIDF